MTLEMSCISKFLVILECVAGGKSRYMAEQT